MGLQDCPHGEHLMAPKLSAQLAVQLQHDSQAVSTADSSMHMCMCAFLG